MQLLPLHVFIRDGFQVLMGSTWSKSVSFGSLNAVVNHLTSTAKFCDASELYERKKPVESPDAKTWPQFQLVTNFRTVNEFTLWLDLKRVSHVAFRFSSEVFLALCRMCSLLVLVKTKV